MATLAVGLVGLPSCALKVSSLFSILRVMMRLSFLALVLLGAGWAGCQKTSAPAPAPAVVPGLPTRAQPKLQTMKIYVGPEEMVAELALTPDQEQTGMMFRTTMGSNESMLFPLPYTQRAAFWMKNCPLPLSAAYIGEDGVIEEIHDLQPFNTNTVFAASENIRFVLETPQGWFQQHHIGTGMAVATERGPLMKTFFQGR